MTLHPLVSLELVRVFSSKETNPNGAQLVFSTHDSSILGTDLLRRDQVWFVEKSDDGSSSFYSLAEIKIRSGDNFEKGYMQGRFGAVPLFKLYREDLIKVSDLNVASEGPR